VKIKLKLQYLNYYYVYAKITNLQKTANNFFESNDII